MKLEQKYLYFLYALVAFVLLKYATSLYDIVLIAFVGYIAYFFYNQDNKKEQEQIEKTNEEMENKILEPSHHKHNTRQMLRNTDYNKDILSLVDHFKKSEIPPNEQSVLNKGIEFLSTFLKYYRKFKRGKQFSIRKVTDIQYLYQQAINTFISLDIQIAGHAHKDRRQFKSIVSRIYNTMNKMFNEIVYNTESIHPEQFDVASSDSYQTPYSHHWEMIA